MKYEAIFFDDGGTINDNNLRGPQWIKLIAEYFIPNFGKTEKEWGNANLFAFNRLMENFRFESEEHFDIDYRQFRKNLDINWLKDMFSYLGITDQLPSDTLVFAQNSIERIIQRVRADIPGIVSVVKELSKNGYRLYTATDGRSWEVKGYLHGLGIDDLFSEFYGPDIINIAKENPLYYKGILKHSNELSKCSILIDDKSENLFRAQEVGFTVIQSCTIEKHKSEFELYFESAEDLLKIINKLNTK